MVTVVSHIGTAARIIFANVKGEARLPAGAARAGSEATKHAA